MTKLTRAPSQGGERIGLIADEAGKAQQRAGAYLHGEQQFAGGRGHGKSDFALVEDVEADGRFTLPEKVVFAPAGNLNGVLPECFNEIGIGEECRWV